MSTKKSKTSIRVVINTTLLIVLGVVFAAISTFSAYRMVEYNNLLTSTHHPTNQASVCFDEKVDEDGDMMTYNEGICNPGTETRADDPNTLALFLDGEIAMAQDMNAYFSAQVMVMIGGFFSISSIFAAIIYWNHNKIK